MKERTVINVQHGNQKMHNQCKSCQKMASEERAKHLCNCISAFIKSKLRFLHRRQYITTFLHFFKLYSYAIVCPVPINKLCYSVGATLRLNPAKYSTENKTKCGASVEFANSYITYTVAAK